MEHRISNRAFSMFLAVTVGCLPPFKALFTRRFSIAPESPVRKRSSFLRSSSSVPGHSPYRWPFSERARNLNDPAPCRHLHDSNIGSMLSNKRASSCVHGSEEAFGSRVSTLERHVEAIKSLDRGDGRSDRDGFEEDGMRVQHDFVSRSFTLIAIRADIEPCEDLLLCAILTDVPKQFKPWLMSYRRATCMSRQPPATSGSWEIIPLGRHRKDGHRKPNTTNESPMKGLVLG